MTSIFINADLTKQHIKQVEEWNTAHPVGTPVLYGINSVDPRDHKGLTTEPAFVLHDQRGGACVRVDTHSFPVSLENLEIDPEPTPPAVVLAVAEALRARASARPRSKYTHIMTGAWHGDWRDHIEDARAITDAVYAVFASEGLTAALHDLAEDHDYNNPATGRDESLDTYEGVVGYLADYRDRIRSGEYTREVLRVEETS